MAFSPAAAAAELADARLPTIFRNMWEMLVSQQSKIKSLEDYLELKNRLWSDRTRHLHSQIEQTGKLADERRRRQTAALDVTVTLKERQAACHKIQLELAESDLVDFCECIEALSAEIKELKAKLEHEKSKESDEGREKVGALRAAENANAEQQKLTDLQGEYKRLKHTYKKFSSKKEAEISALLAEKDFVWNQFKKMESDYSSIKKSKTMEVTQANESIEKLQSLLSQKDETIAKLEAEREVLELEKMRCKEELGDAKEKIGELHVNVEELESSAKEKDKIITRLRNDLAKLQADLKISSAKPPCVPKVSSARMKGRGRSASVTPVRSCFKRASKRCRSVGESSLENRKRLHSNEDQSMSRTSKAVSRLQRCSNARDSRSMSSLGSPRLFSSNFKVPKLKNNSPTGPAPV